MLVATIRVGSTLLASISVSRPLPFKPTNTDILATSIGTTDILATKYARSPQKVRRLESKASAQ